MKFGKDSFDEKVENVGAFNIVFGKVGISRL